jgi:hypothetical protein
MQKTDTRAFVNQLLVYTLVMICFSGSIGLGTVWLRQQIAQTANNVKQLQARTAELSRRTDETNAMIAVECSPDRLQQRNVEWKLGLARTNEPQVVRVNESAEQRLAQKRNSELFVERPTVRPVKFSPGGQIR